MRKVKFQSSIIMKIINIREETNRMLAIFFMISFAMFLIACFSSFYKRKKVHTVLNGIQTFILGLFFSAFLFYIPFYLEVFNSEQLLERIGKTFLMSIHHAISIFVVALNYEDIYAYALKNEIVGAIYACYGALLFVIAPLTTFGFIFTYANSFNAYLRLCVFRRRKVCVFSELNKYTIALAKDIHKNESKTILIFTSVSDNVKASMIEETKNIHARCIKADILSFHIKTLRMANKITYVLLNENEAENLSDIYNMINSEQPKNRREIYVCLDNNNALSEIYNSPNLCIHRFDNVYSLVLETVNSIGVDMFKKDHTCEQTEKTIRILLVGMGRIGTQFMKVLAWYTQVEGYKTEIYAFDKSKNIKERFEHECPGFFDENTSNNCSIKIFGEAWVGTSGFDEKIKQIGNIDYAFVCLGDDELNINTVYDIRSLLFSDNSKHKIFTIVSDIYKGNMLKIKQPADIEFILDVETVYSYDVFFAPQKIDKMIKFNSQWCDDYERIERELYASEEIYKSTESFVVSENIYMCLMLDEEQKKISDHRRWVNYMYSNGYKYGPVKDKIKKLHPMLVTWDKLPEETKFS